MENKIICLDTSVLIDYYRKKDKSKSFFFNLTKVYSLFAISSISEYEIFIGSTVEQNSYWNIFFQNISILPFDSDSCKIAVRIHSHLKSTMKMIEIPDIFIASVAMKNKLTLATLNVKHFERINGLNVLTPEKLLF